MIKEGEEGRGEGRRKREGEDGENRRGEGREGGEEGKAERVKKREVRGEQEKPIQSHLLNTPYLHNCPR